MCWWLKWQAVLDPEAQACICRLYRTRRQADQGVERRQRPAPAAAGVPLGAGPLPRAQPGREAASVGLARRNHQVLSLLVCTCRLCNGNPWQDLHSSAWPLVGRVWSVKDGSLLKTLSAHRGGVYGIAMSPAGDRMYSCGSDNTIQVRSKRDFGSCKIYHVVQMQEEECQASPAPKAPELRNSLLRQER